jgi:glycosyltransferase involved in cell wall biosynthesis
MKTARGPEFISSLLPDQEEDIDPVPQDMDVLYDRAAPVLGPNGGVVKTGKTGLVTVVIPTKNEAANIAWVLEQIPVCVDEVVLVDGNSTDATVVTARSCRPDVRVVAQQLTGKGDALRIGMAAASGDVIVMMDADGSMSPQEIPRFLYFLSNGYDFVKGSRFIGGGGSLDITRTRRLGNHALLQLVNTLYRVQLTDLCYGFFAVHRRYLAFLDLTTPGFEIETQLTICAVRAGLRIAEVPSLELPRRHGQSNLRTFRDGMRVLRTVLRQHRTGVSGYTVQRIRRLVHGPSAVVAGQDLLKVGP